MEVRDDHRPHRRAERLGQGREIQVPVVRRHVRQHRPGADRVDRQEIAGIVVGRQHHLVAGADLEGAKGQLDGQRAAGADGGEGDAVFAGKALFQPLDAAALVLAPGAVAPGGPQRPFNGVVSGRPVRRPFGADRRPAEQGGQVGGVHRMKTAPFRSPTYGKRTTRKPMVTLQSPGGVLAAPGGATGRGARLEVPGRAAQNALRSRARPLRILFVVGPVGVLSVPVGAPLKDIAVHVVQAPGVGLFAAHRMDAPV